MRRTMLAVVASIAVATALPVEARADDPPGLALAKQVVDEVRGAEHKAKMRIVWPEKADETPPEGAEVTLINGYIDCTMTRLVWHDGKVEARSVSTNRSWFYNTQGESFGAAELDVDAAQFATAWSAASYVIGAHDERMEPEPADHANRGGSGGGSHEPHKWIRLRLAGAEAPVHVSDEMGGSWNWEDVLEWRCLRGDAVFGLFKAVIAAASGRRESPLTKAAPQITDEIRRATPRLDLAYHGEHHLLLEVCLRVGGEAGDEATRDAVDALDAALQDDTRSDRMAKLVRENLVDEIDTARAKLRLRLAWDTGVARKLLVADPPKTHRESDLLVWIRRRYREKDPAGYLEFVGEERGRGVMPSAGDRARTLDEIRRVGALDVAALRGLLADDDADVRVAAARAILAISPADKDATTVIVATARDVAIRPYVSEHEIRWPRVDALTEARVRQLIGPQDLHALLAADESQHGLLVQALLDALAASPPPPTSEETLAAWRRVVARPANAGIEVAVTKLLDLKDVESRDAIAAAIERLDKQEAASYGRAELRIDVAGLKKRFAAEMPAPPAPK